MAKRPKKTDLIVPPPSNPPVDAPTPRHIPITVSDVRGVSQLTITAVMGVTDIVEEMHRNIARLAPIVGQAKAGSAPGIAGFVYGSVRGITRLVGMGLDATFAQIETFANRSLAPTVVSLEREAALAVLNGVVGDHLEATGNPLAITMSLRHHGQTLEATPQPLASLASANGKVLVLVHGLCMNDLQWHWAGHDHGATLARDLGYTPIYVHYNTGRHIAANGRALATLFEQLTQGWPVPITELVLLTHSMGGLVARSACYVAHQTGQKWLAHLKKLIFLGTPHHGSALERGGNLLNDLIGLSPYTAPFARLGRLRSAGITDLRYGTILDPEIGQRRQFVPLPAGVVCYAVAATTQAEGDGLKLFGDGLVSIRSALGQHRLPALSLPIPAENQSVFYGVNHFDLLGNLAVYARLKTWLSNTSAS